MAILAATQAFAQEQRPTTPRRGIDAQFRKPNSAAMERQLRANRLKNPRDPDTHTQLARVLMGQPEHSNEVIALAEQATALEPGNANRWIFVAIAYRNALKLDGAIDAATKAIEVNPASADAFFVRGTTHEDMGDRAGAIADYSAAANADPKNPLYPFNAGRLHVVGQEWQEAIDPLRRAISLGWKDTGAHTMLARSLKESGDRDGGIKLLDQLVHDRPEDASAWGARGNFHAVDGDAAAALPDYKKAVELTPSGYNLYNLGWALAEIGKPGEALNYLNEAVAREPDKPYMFFTRGRVLEELALFRQASDDFDRALRISPGVPGYLWERGVARYASGDFKGALEDLTEFNKQDSRAREYTWFWIYLLEWRVEGKRDTSHVEEIARDGKEPWTRTVARFLAGGISEEEFRGSAGTGDDDKSRGERCEAYFYSAAVRDLRGEGGVRDLMMRCIAVEQRNFIEHRLARGELQRLDGMN